jgi:outer membrane protein assembly factor BamB
MVLALDAPTGKRRWDVVTGLILARLTVAGDYLYAGDADGRLAVSDEA